MLFKNVSWLVILLRPSSSTMSTPWPAVTFFQCSVEWSTTFWDFPHLWPAQHYLPLNNPLCFCGDFTTNGWMHLQNSGSERSQPRPQSFPKAFVNMCYLSQYENLSLNVWKYVFKLLSLLLCRQLKTECFVKCVNKQLIHQTTETKNLENCSLYNQRVRSFTIKHDE